jgi:uncharacterized protein YhbP (UPF0306 family)
MSLEELIRQYLSKSRIMQIGSSSDNQPWLCTVHNICDEELNLYWVSDLNRRHSKEVLKNPKVCAYVLVHEDEPNERYIIGISIIGLAKVVEEKLDKSLINKYCKKLNKDKQMANDAANQIGTNRFYKLVPKEIVLFDTKNFPKIPRQVWNLK